MISEGLLMILGELSCCTKVLVKLLLESESGSGCTTTTTIHVWVLLYIWCWWLVCSSLWFHVHTSCKSYSVRMEGCHKKSLIYICTGYSGSWYSFFPLRSRVLHHNVNIFCIQKNNVCCLCTPPLLGRARRLVYLPQLSSQKLSVCQEDRADSRIRPHGVGLLGTQIPF